MFVVSVLNRDLWVQRNRFCCLLDFHPDYKQRHPKYLIFRKSQKNHDLWTRISACRAHICTKPEFESHFCNTNNCHRFNPSGRKTDEKFPLFKQNTRITGKVELLAFDRWLTRPAWRKLRAADESIAPLTRDPGSVSRTSLKTKRFCTILCDPV